MGGVAASAWASLQSPSEEGVAMNDSQPEDLQSDLATAKLDKRVVKTRTAIHEAFRHLICERGLDKVTVSALARQAKIDRKTFYLHYGSVQALFDEEVESLVERILSCVDIEAAQSRRPEQLRGVLDKVNAIISSDVEFFAYIARSLSLEFTLDHIRAAVATYMERRYGLEVGQASEPQLMRLRFLLAGAVAVYGEWLRGDHTQPLEEVSQVIQDIVLSGPAAGEPLFNR